MYYKEIESNPKAAAENNRKLKTNAAQRLRANAQHRKTKAKA